MQDSRQQFEEIISHLKSELAKLRAGRASIELVESVMVDAYGSKMPLNQLATLSSPEPRLVVVQPWDKSNMRAIENSIRSELTDMTPVVDGAVIRIPFPPPTEERRKDLVKQVGKFMEESKVRVRKVREEHISEFKRKEEDGEISEDDMHKKRDELQKVVDEYNKKVDEIGEKKEEEILSV